MIKIREIRKSLLFKKNLENYQLFYKIKVQIIDTLKNIMLLGNEKIYAFLKKCKTKNKMTEYNLIFLKKKLYSLLTFKN